MTMRLKWVAIALISLVIVVVIGLSVYVVLAPYRMESQIYKTFPSQEGLQREGKGAPSVPQVEQAQTEKPIADRLVIKNKSIQLEVKSVKESYSRIEKVAAKFKGTITSSQIYSDTPPYRNGPVPLEKALPSQIAKPLSAVITIKVPVDNFERAVKDLKKLGEIKSEQETTEEVTEQHIDLTARLRNLQRQEARYLEILDLAKNVEEVLKVENELTRIRGEIESLQAQIDYLERSAAMATITLELSEPTPITQPVWKWRFRDAIIKALENFIAAINLLIIVIGTLLPIVILGLIVWFCIYLVKRYKR